MPSRRRARVDLVDAVIGQAELVALPQAHQVG